LGSGGQAYQSCHGERICWINVPIESYYLSAWGAREDKDLGLSVILAAA